MQLKQEALQKRSAASASCFNSNVNYNVVKIVDIIKSEERDENNLFVVRLYNDGNFYHAYEWSAYLSHLLSSKIESVSELKPIHKNLNGYEDGYVMIGFPVLSLNKFFPNLGDNSVTNEYGTVEINVCEYFDDICISDYDRLLREWRSSIEVSVKNKGGKSVKNKAQDNSIQNNNELQDLISEIISYPIEGKTLIDCLSFLLKIRNDLLKIKSRTLSEYKER